MLMLLLLLLLLRTCSLEDTANSEEDQRSPLGQTQHPLEDHLEEKHFHSISIGVVIAQLIPASTDAKVSVHLPFMFSSHLEHQLKLEPFSTLIMPFARDLVK